MRCLAKRNPPFQVPCVIQMTDDEKFLFRGNTIEDLERMTKNNAREV